LYFGYILALLKKVFKFAFKNAIKDTKIFIILPLEFSTFEYFPLGIQSFNEHSFNKLKSN